MIYMSRVILSLNRITHFEDMSAHKKEQPIRAKRRGVVRLWCMSRWVVRGAGRQW
jgi:hypothetical protein